ncbi:glycosyltransferase family 39 protein [Candidatus Woesearchaeota archaeon]|nr:glycosyltransferase family 39 protein [Candidatus Woesearchaeota archaeon]
MKFFTQKNLVIALFLVFLFLRLFVDKTSMFFGGDSLKFLETAKRFPYHTLYNNQLYLLHPPFYPYTIYFFNLTFQQDHIAGIVLSLVSSIITFFILYRFFMMLTDNFNITFFVLLFFTLSVGFIEASHIVFRESYVIMLALSALYFYAKGVRFNSRKSIIASSVFSGLLAMTSDHVIFLIPAIVLSYIIFNSKKIEFKKLIFPNLKYAILPLIIAALFYGSWTLIKYAQYSKHENYPNGYAGMPLSTHDLGLPQAFLPQFFEDYDGPKMGSDLIAAVKRISFNIGYMLNMQPFPIPKGLNFTTMKFLLKPVHILYMIIVYIPLALLAIYGFMLSIKETIKWKKIHDNINLYMIFSFFIFASPILQKLTNPRYMYIAYLFFFYFMSYGLVSLIGKIKSLQIHSKVIPAIIISLLILVPFWYYKNPHIVVFNKKIAAAQNTADFIKKNLPKDAGIMAQGYSVELIYLTGNRVIGLYSKPEKLMNMVSHYNISYIVLTERFNDYFHLSEKSADFVRNNPSKFKLVATIKEDYSGFYSEDDPARTDEVYVYKIV